MADGADGISDGADLLRNASGRRPSVELVLSSSPSELGFITSKLPRALHDRLKLRPKGRRGPSASSPPPMPPARTEGWCGSPRPAAVTEPLGTAGRPIAVPRSIKLVNGAFGTVALKRESIPPVAGAPPGSGAASSPDLLKPVSRFWPLGPGGRILEPGAPSSLVSSSPSPSSFRGSASLAVPSEPEGSEIGAGFRAARAARTLQHAWRAFVAAHFAAALPELALAGGNGDDGEDRDAASDTAAPAGGQGPKLSFEELARRLRSPRTLAAATRLLARVSSRLAAARVPCAALSPRIYLAAVMLAIHPEEAASPRGSAPVHEVVAAARGLLDATQRMLDGAPGALRPFAAAWTSYFAQFAAWKQQDAENLAGEVIAAAASHE